LYTSNHIAIVILNYNGLALLKQFLPSVVAYSDKAKIYVVDNCSTDESVAWVSSSFSDVVIIKHHDNFGYAKGYNEALHLIAEPLVCLLNSDVEVTKNWLTPILKLYNTSSEVAIIQPKIKDFKNKSYFEYAGAAGGFIDSLGYPYCRGRWFTNIEEDKGQYNDTSQIFWASGACFFIKQSVFEKLNGFDEDFFAHFEEIDLCWRAYNHDFKTVYTSLSEIYHVGGATLASYHPKKTFLNFRNSLFTLLKNEASYVWAKLFMRMILDGIAGLVFLAQLKPQHFVAILKAHGSFYLQLNTCLKKRQQLPQQPLKRKITSIVWSYYILSRKKV